MKKADRQNVRVKVDFERYDLDGKLVDVIAKLQETLNGVPEEYRASVDMDVSSDLDYGSSYVQVEVGYYRPETDEEMAARKERAKAYNKATCHRDRAEYERLKKRFG